MFAFLRQRRRAQLRTKPFPSVWRRILERNVALYSRLPPADRQELREHVHIFLAEKRFEGCGLQVITDDVRVTIAGQAAMLLLHRQTDYFPTVSAVLVYPDLFWANQVEMMDRVGLIEYHRVLLGQVWRKDLVVLAWKDALAGGRRPDWPHNLVLHEFAHALDDEDGSSNGLPHVGEGRTVRTWAKVFAEAYAELKRACADGRPSALDAYGTMNPAEFFAVATTTFFAQPAALREEYPDLYEQLRQFYRQEPTRYHEAAPPIESAAEAPEPQPVAHGVDRS